MGENKNYFCRRALSPSDVFDACQLIVSRVICQLCGDAGCHTYCLSRLGGSHVHLTMAVGRKLIMLRWKHSAWSALLPQPLDTDTNIIDEFEVTNVSRPKIVKM